MLENDIAARIGKHELFDDVATVARHVTKHEGRHAIIHRPDHARGVTFLFREIAAATGDDEAEISRTGIVDTGIVDLVENAVAQSEPNAAYDRGRGADSALRARSPARGNARMPGRLIITARSHSGAP